MGIKVQYFHLFLENWNFGPNLKIILYLERTFAEVMFKILPEGYYVTVFWYC